VLVVEDHVALADRIGDGHAVPAQWIRRGNALSWRHRQPMGTATACSGRGEAAPPASLTA